MDGFTACPGAGLPDGLPSPIATETPAVRDIPPQVQ